MLVLTRKNRESVVIGQADGTQIALEITVLEIEGGRVRLGFEADNRLPIHQREVWDRICNGNGNGAAGTGAAAGSVDGATSARRAALGPLGGRGAIRAQADDTP